jgi:DNA replication protein DnaC
MNEPDFKDILGLTVDNLKEGARRYKISKGIGCPLCDYSGYTTNQNGKDAMCSCEKEKFLKELYAKANVPNVYVGKTLDDWNTRTDAHGRELGIEQINSERVYTLTKYFEKHLENIVNNDPPYIRHTGNMRTPLHSIIFDGKNGSGKTFIGAVLVQSAIKKGLSAKYFDWTEIISILSDYDKKDEFDKMNEEFKNIDFIVIDGIEQYKHTHPQFPQNLDRLAKSRVNSGKPFILLTYGTSGISSGSGWGSLLRNCLTIRLPYTR